MKYLVISEVIESSIPWDDKEKIIEHVEGVVASYEKLVQLEAEKKVLGGGGFVGKRALAFIAEAASNEELDLMLRSLPIWAFHEVEIIPLDSFEFQIKTNREVIEHFKAAPGSD